MALILRGINFGSVCVASGTLNFFGLGKGPGHGWWYHKYYKALFGSKFDFGGATLIAKTTTLAPRNGNMPLDKNLQPKELFPECTRVYPLKGIALNAVGLSGPGFNHLIRMGEWQKIAKPFFISFMVVGERFSQRIRETHEFTRILKAFLPNFQAPVGLEFNFSCPNTEHNPQELEKEILSHLELLREEGLSIPVMVKINVLVKTETVKTVADSGLCDAISISNTIPWGQLPERVDWKKLFGSNVSPLAKFGGGGLSGWPLVEIVLYRIHEFRQAGVRIPILGGGGIGCKFENSHKEQWDIWKYHYAGANAVAIGSMALLRPWKISSAIRYAKLLYKEVPR